MTTGYHEFLVFVARHMADDLLKSSLGCSVFHAILYHNDMKDPKEPGEQVFHEILYYSDAQGHRICDHGVVRDRGQGFGRAYLHEPTVHPLQVVIFPWARLL